MANLPWLENVRQRLARHALPPAYVERFLGELTDHFHDLKEENMDGDVYSRLGEPEQVAEAAVVAYRQRSFFGKHPAAAFLVFGLSPVVPQFALGYIAAFVLTVAIELLAHLCGFDERAIGRVTWDCGFSLMIAICSALASILYNELAVRLGIGRKWMFTSCTVLAVMAVLWERGLHDDMGFYRLVLPVQFLVPVAVGWWSARRRYDQKCPVTAFFVFAVSPIASFMALRSIVALASWSGTLNLAIDIILSVIPSIVYCKIVWPSGIGRKWVIVLCTVPAIFAATVFAWVNAGNLIPLLVLSLLYCQLSWRSGMGRRWLFISCAVLATFAAMLSLACSGKSSDSLGGLEVYSLIALQFVVPLAIGWWFLRRQRDAGQLQLAS
jgi:hypothetical protein